MNSQIISWHPNAVLVDHTHARLTAQMASNVAASENCDPTDPLTALPAYINAIDAGFIPIMGHLDQFRPNAQGDFLTQTGGSTGRPKTILRSSESWLLSFNHMAKTYGVGTSARVAALGHLNHSLALYAALEALHLGAEFHALGGLTPAQYGTELVTREITHLYATPTQLRLIRSGDIADVAFIFVGGGAMDDTGLKAARMIFPNAQILQFYGAAETSFITLSDANTPAGSVGKAFSNVVMEIRTDAGHPCPTGTIGQVWVTTPLAFKGYLSDQQDLAHTNDGFLSVGELGYLDKTGNLFLKGRADRAITIADQTVYLDEVEAALTRSPRITNAAVFSQPDRLRGASLVAIVCSSYPLSELSDISGPLPNHTRPKRILAVQNWPLLPSGKTDYIALQTLLKEHLE